MTTKKIYLGLFFFLAPLAAYPKKDKPISLCMWMSKEAGNKVKLGANKCKELVLSTKKTDKLTLQDLLEIRKNSFEKYRDILVAFTRSIDPIVTEKKLFEGFQLSWTKPALKNELKFTLSGTPQEDKKENPKEREDLFLSYCGPKEIRYKEIRKKSEKIDNYLKGRFEIAFDRYFEVPQNNGAKTLVIASMTGSTLLVVPRYEAVTIWDLSIDLNDGKVAQEDVVAFWDTIFLTIQKYENEGNPISGLLMNIGNSAGGAQTVPHLHCRLAKSLRQKSVTLFKYNHITKKLEEAKENPETNKEEKDQTQTQDSSHQETYGYAPQVTSSGSLIWWGVPVLASALVALFCVVKKTKTAKKED